MSIEKKDIDRILSLNKADFEKRLSGAVKSAGVDPQISGAILKDSDKIKKALEGLDEKGLAKLSEIIKKNNLGQLEQIIKNEFDS